MDRLTLRHCKQLQKTPSINPLTGHTIKIGGPTFLTLQEKCEELQRKHKNGTTSPIPLHTIQDFKPIIISQLTILLEDEIAQGNYFKARAYEKVIKGLQLIDYPVLAWKDISHVQGIGGKIEAKIKEILKEGQLFRAQEIQSNPRTASLLELMQVHGIGDAKARQLYKQGIYSIQALRVAVKETPGILNDVQKIGLKYVEDFQERIPREEMDLHYALLHEVMSKFGLRFEIVGSYRRGSDSSGDIYVLVYSNKADKGSVLVFYQLIDILQHIGYLTDTLAEGSKKYMGVAKLPDHRGHRRIDLNLTSKEHYPFALVHTTGSDHFNIMLRTVAEEKGYRLNEYGLQPLKRGLEVPEIRSERELLHFLIGRYVKPEDRK